MSEEIYKSDERTLQGDIRSLLWEQAAPPDRRIPCGHKCAAQQTPGTLRPLQSSAQPIHAQRRPIKVVFSYLVDRRNEEKGIDLVVSHDCIDK
jgi:hypothetical protein